MSGLVNWRSRVKTQPLVVKGGWRSVANKKLEVRLDYIGENRLWRVREPKAKNVLVEWVSPKTDLNFMSDVAQLGRILESRHIQVNY